MSLPNTVDVLVVGGGPVGMAAACTILNNLPQESRASFKLLVVDRNISVHHIPQNQSRAIGLHARTFEVLAEFVDEPEVREKQTGIRGRESAPILQDAASVPDRVDSVTQSLLERGILLTKGGLRLSGRPKPILHMKMASALQDSQFQQICCIPQRVTEAVLRARLNALGANVEGGWTVVDIVKKGREGKVLVTLEHDKLGRHDVETDFVVGADGGHSAVRQLSGLAFPRQSMKEPMILADVKTADERWPFEYKTLGYEGVEGGDTFCKLGFGLLLPMPGNWLRVAANFLPPDFDPGLNHVRGPNSGGHVEGHGPTREQMQWVLDQYLPTDAEWMEGGSGDRSKKPGEIVEMRWSTVFKIHHGIVRSYLEPETGRIALIGDAAHVHSPMGGRGLNNGIQDATSLGMTLVENLDSTQEARQTALQSWADERRKIGLMILNETNQQTVMATLKNPILQFLRNCLLRLLAFFPSVSREMIRNMTGITSRPEGWKPNLLNA
ncbi:FAD/NAD(P)-binding domain-containing protein [Violaceomyces palustris]|uniref:FAD/NAD(P)-binding domain-containing protein n=1 Tax=Violaceomyces palustris TaxID=1673888 RepID=A0ACD0P2E4_9BASI|nr:FAD/NAD(P)-binding domain-containing protein [Violaceomyces palustris]